MSDMLIAVVLIALAFLATTFGMAFSLYAGAHDGRYDARKQAAERHCGRRQGARDDRYGARKRE